MALLGDALGFRLLGQPRPHFAVFRLDECFCKHVLQLGHTVIFVAFLRAMLLADYDDFAVLVDVVTVQLGCECE